MIQQKHYVLFVETKVRGGRLSAIQKATIERMQESGLVVLTVTDPQQVLACLAPFL